MAKKFNQAAANRAILGAAKRAARGARIDARFRWYGDQIEKGIKVEFATRLRDCGQLLQDRIIAHISVPIRYTVGPRGGITVTERSKPGEPPRTQAPLRQMGLGNLVNSIFYSLLGPTWLRVGTTLDYGLFLETGTSQMEPRPYILRTVNDQYPQLRRILGAQILILPGVPNG